MGIHDSVKESYLITQHEEKSNVAVEQKQDDYLVQNHTLSFSNVFSLYKPEVLRVYIPREHLESTLPLKELCHMNKPFRLGEK